MSSNPLADRIAEIIEQASPRVRKVLQLTKDRKFPEGVADPDKRYEQSYWLDWSSDLQGQLAAGELQIIGYDSACAGNQQVSAIAGSASKPTTAQANFAGPQPTTRYTAVDPTRLHAGSEPAAPVTGQQTAQSTETAREQPGPSTT